MSVRVMKPGEILHCEDGVGIVVEPDTSPVDGLIQIVEYVYGGEPFASDNPAIVAALPRIKVQQWRNCTKALRESLGGDAEEYESYWHPDGDGASEITVAYYDGSGYGLGEAALAAEPRPVSSLPAVGGEQR